MIKMKVRISDTVMSQDDWNIWELVWCWNPQLENFQVASQRVLQPGCYGQDFTSWNPVQLAAWSSYDGTGSHPECFHEIYSTVESGWRSFVKPTVIISMIHKQRSYGQKFILWNRADGDVPLDDEGKINSGGLIGRVKLDNIYLRSYADYPDHRRPDYLEVGEAIDNVVFTLSGSYGSYSVVRVV